MFIFIREENLMAKTFQPNIFIRLGNRVIGTLLRAGLPIGIMALLTVPGRKSGLPRTTPVAVVEADEGRYLVAGFGIVDWVRNLRAAGGGTLTRRGRTEAIHVVELPPAQAAPILKAGFGREPSFLHAYFNVSAESPLADFEREAAQHPVFQIQPVGASAGAR
jgi:deazaflavin-dependent oxidoreductase (nitroreductase family)